MFVLAPLPPDCVTRGCHFTSRNLSFHFCKMGKSYRTIPHIYLEINSGHIAVINAVSFCSVSREVFSIDFFLWFWVKFMQVAIFSMKTGGEKL